METTKPKRTTKPKGVQVPAPEQVPVLTLEMIISHPIYEAQVLDVVLQIIHSRKTRPMCKPGYHYVRDGIDRLWNEGNLNKDFMLSQTRAIITKTSSLPSTLRTVVRSVVMQAIQQSVPLIMESMKPVSEAAVEAVEMVKKKRTTKPKQ